MTFSLNEVEATAKRATRGVGYPWGIAEDSAKATRWLCAHGLDGCGALARALTWADQAKLPDISPQIDAPAWISRGDMLCPLLAGAALSDRAKALPAGGVELKQVSEPLLLMPFAALIARTTDQTVTLDWAGGLAEINASDVELRGDLPDGPAKVRCHFGGEVRHPRQLASRADPAKADWSALLAFAHRTYAPATEESRLKGAG